MADQTCPIFKTPADVHYDGERDLYDVISMRAGGKYKIAQEVIENNEIQDALKPSIARWIYEQNQIGEVPEILNFEIEFFEKRMSLTVSQRAEELLRFLDSQSESIAKLFTWITGTMDGNKIPPIVLAATESVNDNEVEYLIGFLESLGFLEKPYNNTDYFRISPAGYAHLQTIPMSLSNQAFVAMWFNDEVNDAYVEAIEPAIRNAGYKSMRIDRKQHNNKIDDEIISEIRKSKFVIADFTSGYEGETLIARGGVYYEAGFAHGLGLPVIWTCREDCIKHVHFDTRQYNHIVWKTYDELYKKLKNRIEATIT